MLDSSDQISNYYKVLKPIAQGSFGKVYLCQQQLSNLQYAVKIIDKSAVRKQKIELLRSQAKILQNVDHQNIIKMRGIRQTDHYIYLEMDYAKYGTLGQLIKERKDKSKKLSIEEIASAMRSIFNGVSHLHSLNIIHRDLKPQNILACEQFDLTTLKIADFGLSIKVDFHSSKPNQHCGTLLFMAPEVIKKHPYTKSVDIWSCAVIMYMLFNNGQHPLVSLKQKISAEKYLQQISKPWPKLSDELAQDFLQKISKVQPIQRYTAAEALKHPFLTRNLNDSIPLTYNESFRSFEINQKSSQIIRLSIILSKHVEVGDKITIDKCYLQKVDLYNQQSSNHKKKLNQAKRISKKKFFSSHDVRQIFSGFQHKVKYDSIQSDSPKRIDPQLKTSRINNILNISFVSHFDQCIKIMDLKQQLNSQQSKSLKIQQPVIKAQNSFKLQQFLISNSFSPTKRKRSIINFPKISRSKQKIINLNEVQKTNIPLRQEFKIKQNDLQIANTSPNKRIVSSRKYKRSVNEQTNRILPRK